MAGAGIGVGIAYLSSRVIDIAGNFLAQKIRGVGDTVAAVASQRTLPLDRMFVSVVDKAGDFASALGVLPGSILKVGAALIEGAVKIKDGLLARAEEIKGFSADITVASARREIAHMRMDQDEAEKLGKSMSRLIDAQTRLDEASHGTAMVIKEAFAEVTADLMETLADVMDKITGTQSDKNDAITVALDKQTAAMIGNGADLKELVRLGVARSHEDAVLVNDRAVNEALDMLWKTGMHGESTNPNTNRGPAPAATAPVERKKHMWDLISVGAAGYKK